MVSEGRKGQNNPTKHTQALTLLNYPQLRNKALLIELIPEHPNMYWKETNQEGEEMPRLTWVKLPFISKDLPESVIENEEIFVYAHPFSTSMLFVNKREY